MIQLRLWGISVSDDKTMKNLLTQDPPDHELRTRDKSFFSKYPNCVGRLDSMDPINHVVFGVLSDVHLAIFFCHFESLVHGVRLRKHFF